MTKQSSGEKRRETAKPRSLFEKARKFVEIDHDVRCSGATKRHCSLQNLRATILAQ